MIFLAAARRSRRASSGARPRRSKRAWRRPPSAAVEVGLATAARKLGDAPRAIEALRRAVALDAEDADSWNELGALLMQREQVEPAIEAFELAVALRPADEMYRRNLEFARGIRASREK